MKKQPVIPTPCPKCGSPLIIKATPADGGPKEIFCALCKFHEEEPDPLSPARAAIATAMQAAKVSEVTGAPLPKPLTWKRGFYDTTRTFPSGWYECPVCGCRVDWEPEQCPKCYTRLEPEETEE